MVKATPLSILYLTLLSGGFFANIPVANADVTCSVGMKDGTNFYKATSIGGINITSQSSSWVSDGVYSITMNIMANQGMKYWYNSTTKSDWSIISSRSDSNVGQLAKDCSSGLVVAAQKITNNVKIGTGTGTVTLTAGVMGGMKGQSFVLYDEKIDGLINMSSILVTSGYAGGVSKEDDNITRKIDFKATFTDIKGVADGNYTVNVVIPIGATTTWFPNGNGYNYWWATSDKSIPLSYSITVPVNIRFESEKPVDPTGRCTSPTSVTLDHKEMSPAQVNGKTVQTSIVISCNAAMSGSFELSGDNDSSADMTQVDLGKGVTSKISASIDGKNWYRKLSSFSLSNGSTNLLVRSVLSTTGTPEAGAISGSAVMVIKYN